MNTAYRADIDQLLARQHDNGADAFMTPDGKLLKGGPFTALESAGYLLELGVPPEHPVLAAVAERIFAWIRPDGRIRTAQTGAIYPCQTALALVTLCRMGFADDERLAGTFAYFLDTQQPDGGWKCNKYSFGRGPETEYSTPYTTLLVLDAFRYRPQSAQAAEKLSHAVNFLLAHWEIRTPISPCHYGIGSRFLQVEYPFRGYYTPKRRKTQPRRGGRSGLLDIVRGSQGRVPYPPGGVCGGAGFAGRCEHRPLQGLRLAAGFAVGLPPLSKGGGTAEGRDGGIALRRANV